MKKHFLHTVICLIIFSVLLTTVGFAAEAPYKGYNYDGNGVSYAAQNGYYPVKQVTLSALGENAVYDPIDLFVQEERGEIYIVDQTDGVISVLDREYRFLRKYSSFQMKDGKETALNKPSSIFVTADGKMYIADKDNGRILVADSDGNVTLEIGRPDTAQYVSTVAFHPEKVLVDRSGSIFTIVRGITQGALVFSSDGTFKRYFGSNKVSVSLKLMVDWTWKRLMNEEQRSNMANYVPVEFLNFDIDELGFIYTVSYNSGKADKRLCKYNFLSENSIPEGRQFGDLESVVNGEFVYTRFTDISIDKDGYICALDLARGRVFRYNSDFQLLFVYGGLNSSQLGYFTYPVAIDNIGEDTLVLDNTTQSITVFSPTEFGAMVEDTIETYNSGNYTKALEPWEKIAQLDENFSVAYRGIGDGKFMMGDYTGAMESYKKANDTAGYSKAFRQFRTQMVRQYFYLVFVAIGLALLIFAAVRIRNKKRRAVPVSGRTVRAGGTLKRFLVPIGTPFRVMLHPIVECEEIAYKKNGRISSGIFVLILFFFEAVIRFWYTGFEFNANYLGEFNIFMILAQTIGIALAFIVINWLMSSLMDGKGFLHDVFVVSSYALLPYTLVSFLVTAVSNMVVAEEYILVQFIYYVGLIWSAAQLIIGLKAVHDYSTGKTIWSILLSIAGIVICAFVLVLSFAVIQQVANIVATMFNEIMFRL